MDAEVIENFIYYLIYNELSFLCVKANKIWKQLLIQNNRKFEKK